MAITNAALKPFVLNATDIQFLLDQVKFKPLFDIAGNAIINWDGTGTVYNAYGAAIGTGGLVAGDAAALAAITAYGSSYQNITDLAGLRDPSGFNNNLTLVHAHWGQAGYDFPRTAQAVYDKYSKEVILPADTTFSALPLVTNATTSATTNQVLSSSDDNSSSTSNNITVKKTVLEQVGVATVVEQGSTVATSVRDGHHTLVNLIDTTTTTSTTTSTYLFDKITTTSTITDVLHPTNTATTTNTQTTQTMPVQQGLTVTATGPTVRTLTGGELDTTTMIDGHVAHTFKGVVSTGVGVAGTYGTITNGVTTAANYANPWDSVVDYTPRMISRVTTTAGVVYDTWANHAGEAGAANHVPNEIYYDAKGVAKVLDWGLLATAIEKPGVGLGQVDTQARLAASAGQDDHFIGGLNPGVSPSNGFFVLFGQFFDHGLDFIDKGGQGSVIKIALAVDDPLYGMLGPDGRPTTSITINRATVDHMDGSTPQYVNHTSPFIDQSQTYGSTSQVTNLLREWVSDTTTSAPGDFHAGMKMFDGKTLATAWTDGHGVTSTDTLPTLNELRAHVLATGRDGLTWEDISDLRNRDASGHVTTGTSGSALILDSNPRFDDGHLHNGSPAQDAVVDAAIATLNAAAISLGGVGSTFAIDPTTHKLTVHFATVPSFFPPGTPNDLSGASSLAAWVNFTNFSITAPAGAVHDAVGEILMASVGDHYIAGDGRVNENFGLTSIHHIFHEEHNFQVQNLMEALHTQDIATGDVNHVKLHEFQIVTGSQNAAGDYLDSAGKIAWDMDKMFNATKLIVEMEYQHAAVDQYARNVTPNIQEFVGYSPDKNPGVSLEYAQGAFRFGHSTLRETIDTIDPTHGLTGKIMGYALRDAFLNPDKYAEVGPAAILLGMSHQQQNEVDEFITPALNQGLLGQPLDLAAINIARGRDIGLPTLNDFRQALGLARYTSWTDFSQNMQHPQSLANFIAAYSFDGDLAKAQAIIDLASGVLTGTVLGFTAVTATTFLSGGDLGFNLIDTWLGGLAEIHQPGGLLGETFDKVFVNQIESLMDGDRFYYLYRLAGQQFAEEVGNGQLKDIVERNSGLTHLNGNIFGYADQYIDLGAKKEVVAIGAEAQTTGNEHKYGDDVAVAAGAKGIYSNGGLGNSNDGSNITVATTITVDSNGVLQSTTTSQTYVQDTRLADSDPLSAFAQNGGVNLDGTPNSGAESNEVIVGSAGNDLIYAQGGDDTVYGDGGNDIIYGGFGIDRLYGGAGKDVIYGGDNPDLIDGGSGDDILFGESSGSDINGADQIIGGSGNDYIDGGIGIDKLSGGTGDDHILGGQDTDPFTHGSDGNDWIEGNSGGDILYGDNGDDLVVGGADQDQMFGGNGDDIIRPGDQTGALTIGTDEVLGGDGTTDEGNKPGTLGFDLVDLSDNAARPGGVVFDLGNQLNPNVTVNGTPTQLPTFQIEGVVGSVSNDTLVGSNAGDAGLVGDLASLDLGENWLVGGSGNDVMTGNGGNDIIVGGSIRLDALIGKYNSGYTHNNNNDGLTQADILQDAQYQGASHRVLYSETIDNTGLIDAANAAVGGTLFDKHFTEMLRSSQFKDMVLGDAAGLSAGGNDTATYSGEATGYSFAAISAGGITGWKVTDTNLADGNDGTDIVVGVNNLRFETTTALNRAENTVLVTTVTTAAAGPATYVLSGADAALFSVNASGQLVFNTPPNFESAADAGANNVYDVTVAATTAGLTLVQSYAVNVTNVNEAPNFTSGLAFTINENTTTVTTVAAVDPEGTAITYGLTGANAALFTINATTGALAFVSPATAVNPSSVYNVTVTATDGVNTTSAPLTITVNNINQPPTISTMSLTVAENTQAVGTVLATDADGDALTYSIAAGGDGALFSISSTGALSFQSALGANFEVKSVYNVNVSVSDGVGPAVVQGLTVNVTNVNEAATGAPVISDVTPTAGQALSLNLAGVVDLDGSLTAITYQWQSSANGTTWTNIAGATASTFTPVDTAGSGADPQAGLQLRAVVSYTAGGLAGSVTSAPTGPSGENWTSTSLLGETHTATAGDDLVTGGLGADTLNGGAGDDVFTYNVNAPILNFNLSGRDIIDGGSNTLTVGDSYVLNGTAAAETFRIYTAAAWQALGAATHTINAGTEIVITRNGTTNASVISELRNIEEITINTNNITANDGNGVVNNGLIGGDTIAVFGNFATTSLNYSTIHVNGSAGNDIVDISGLESAHRIVFDGGTGTNEVVGSVRTQDILTNANVVTTSTVTSGSGDDTATPPPAPVVDLTLIGDDTANLLSGAGGNDVAIGNGGDDLLSTGDGADVINAGAGADTVVAGAGDDMVYGQDGADTIFGGTGKDMLDGGNGDDTVFGGSEDDMFVAHVNDGTDSYHGDAGSDTLDMSAVMANIEVNLGTGFAGWAKVGTVTDQLYSVENVVTGGGNDTITASGAHNVIDTGAGHDKIVFHSASDANGDTILNFEAGDKIDVSDFMGGTVNLVSGSTAAAGQIAVSFENIGGENFTVLHGHDVNDNTFEIDIKGHHALTGTDFAA
jgi:Ca2+-binding RTX toxin-like protein